ncbi:MAG: histidine phosphotransferase [Alphaproteobacteria bacterium]|nr:MAG: histidine phosphotransferase [Alphaproteobacteria bacterium]
MTETSSTDPTRIAELVASRLCHDLINPVGAIGNGVELMQATLPPSPELELLSESAATASAKIRLFRIAFGAASASETVEARVLAEILAGAYRGGRIEIDWPPQPLHRTEARLMLLAVMCAESALPLGGRIRVETGEGAVTIAVEARRTRFETEPWAHLIDGVALAECRSALVHFPFARSLLAAAGRRARLEETPAGFTLSFAG